MYSYKTDGHLIVNKHEYTISNKSKFTLQEKSDRTNDLGKVLKNLEVTWFRQFWRERLWWSREYSSVTRRQRVRELILHIGLITMEIPLKLFLDMEPSSSANVVSAWAIDPPSKPLLLNREKRDIQLAQNKQQSIIFLHEVHCTEAAIDTWRSE